MTKLDNSQEAYLRAFEAKYTAYKSAKQTLAAHYAELLEREMLSITLEASAAGNLAVQHGVPFTHLGIPARSGMKTKNTVTIKSFLALTAQTEIVEVADYDPRGDNVKYYAETGLYTVTAPNGTSYALNSDFDPVPFVYPLHMDQGWWIWWSEAPEGRATVEPFITEQENARVVA